MTGPLPDDVVSGCLAMLRAEPQVCEVFANPADPADPLIADVAPTRGEYLGAVAVVVSNAGAYGAPVGGHTDDGVRLQLELWADPADPGQYEPGVQRRLLDFGWKVLDEVLYRPGGSEQWWGTVRTISVDRLARISSYEVPSSGGLWRGTAFYGVGIG